MSSTIKKEGYTELLNKIREEEGEEEFSHDNYRHKIIKEHIPKKLKELEREEQLGMTLKEAIADAELDGFSIEVIMDKVSAILGKEEGQELYYNIIQGPLGADRLDYLIRDAYILGAEYGKIRLDRLTSYVHRSSDNKLCYSVKIFDEVHSALSTRFYMYKNIYSHKTVRAVDILLHQLLECSVEPLNLVERTKDLEKFEEINEAVFFGEIMAKSEDLHSKILDQIPKGSKEKFESWWGEYIKDEVKIESLNT